MATYNFVVDGSYVNISGVANTHARLHNSSQAIEWFYDGSGDLVFSIDDVPYLVKDMSEVIIDGVTLTDPSEFETNIKLIFPGYAGGGAGFPAGTKMYTALLSQSGTDAPVAAVLQNTLGGTVVWTRAVVDRYRGTQSNAFTENKTFIQPGFPVSLNHLDGTIFIYRNSVNVIEISFSGNEANELWAAFPFQIQILVFP